MGFRQSSHLEDVPTTDTALSEHLKGKVSALLSQRKFKNKNDNATLQCQRISRWPNNVRVSVFMLLLYLSFLWNISMTVLFEGLQGGENALFNVLQRV